MAITGGVKFFGDNVALYEAGGYVVASTGQVVALNIIDKLSYTSWRSVGSNDSTTETLTVTFGSSTITRLLLLDFNWKNYTVQYWNGTTWVNFTSVVGLDGSKSAISETAFADNSAYYEFASVTTTQIKITVNTTQTANAEKYLATLMLTTELGTFAGFPKIEAPTFSRNPRTNQMLSGRKKIVKQPSVFAVTVTFENYPVLGYGADSDLVFSLFDREAAFYIWLCGGRRGTNYFSYDVPGWRLKDVFRVQTDTDITSEWSDNMYKRGQNLGSILFSEHV
jgi:hypothetical protein